MSTDVSGLEAVFRRDRIVIVTGLAAVALVAWAYLFYVAGRMGTAGEMGAMDMAAEMAMPHIQRWRAVELGLILGDKEESVRSRPSPDGSVGDAAEAKLEDTGR